MAKRIMNAALKERVFDEVVIAVVSQTVDELRIQLEIGGSLGLTDLKDETAQGRVQKLHERLSSGTKRILVVLDDVWKNMKLNELGIPCGKEDSKRGNCTVLITSRNNDALTAMNVKKIFGMKELSKEDAWFLFREKAGTCVEDVELNSTAKEVVGECKGLPIALEAVGAALIDEKSKSVWDGVLKKLRKPNPKNTPGFISDVYNPLIVSYDMLDNEEVKSMFLLCCLFREDAIISVELLTHFCMGLRIFEDAESVEEARDWACTLIKSLKSRSLLLDGEDDDHVRMHDVVRDVCIFIAKQKGYIGGIDGTWISNSVVQLPPTDELRSSTIFPNLRLLLLMNEEEQMKIENTSFQGMRELFVLYIRKLSFTSLPSLINLRTLVLMACDDLETISFVGGLVNLEILICRWCGGIEELPHEIGGLKQLKVLDVTGCGELQRIAPGIISSLVGLEELRMSWSFHRWEADDDERREMINASLGELESLKKLTCLEIEIRNPALAAQQINLSPKIERFRINVGSIYFNEESNHIIFICWEEGIRLADWMEKLMKKTECLTTYRYGPSSFDLANVPNIRLLHLGGENTRHIIVTTTSTSTSSMDPCPHMEGLFLDGLNELGEIWNGPISSNPFRNLKAIILEDLPALRRLWSMMDNDNNDATTITLFPHLELLVLKNVDDLQEIWSDPISSSSNAFQNLKEIKLEHLPAMKQLWKTNTGLPQLESLEIRECEMMEQVFMCEEDSETTASIHFPRLNKIRIKHCPKLRSLVGFGTNEDQIDDDHHYSHLFCQPHKLVSFGTLKKLVMGQNPFCRGHNIHVSFFNGLESLSISKYGGSMSLFMPSLATELVNLKELYIKDCDEMVQVIEAEEEEELEPSTTLLFPKLEQIELRGLDKLETFCEWKHGVELPLLKQLKIYVCPNMAKFTLGSIATPHLESVWISIANYNIDASTDLNGALQQHHIVEQDQDESDG